MSLRGWSRNELQDGRHGGDGADRPWGSASRWPVGSAPLTYGGGGFDGGSAHSGSLDGGGSFSSARRWSNAGSRAASLSSTPGTDALVPQSAPPSASYRRLSPGQSSIAPSSSYAAAYNHNGNGNRNGDDGSSSSAAGRQVRWVPDDVAGAAGALADPRLQHRRAASEPLVCAPAAAVALPPSPLLVEVVRSVAHYRGVRCPAAIFPEVSLAFDEYLSRGVVLKKFVPSGPPHDRFFTIKFLDLQHRRGGGGLLSRLGHRGGRHDPEQHTQALPEAVFCWYRTPKSRTMRRYFPLSDLCAVRRGGAGHPYVERQRAKRKFIRGGPVDAAGDAAAAEAVDDALSDDSFVLPQRGGNVEEDFSLIKCGKKGLSNKYITDSHVVQLIFRSPLTGSEEKIAFLAPNPTVRLALLVVADYITRIGYDV